MSEDITPEDIELNHARWLYCVAFGGYIDGSHTYEDMRRMEAEAEAICRRIEYVPPPWEREPGAP